MEEGKERKKKCDQDGEKGEMKERKERKERCDQEWRRRREYKDSGNKIFDSMLNLHSFPARRRIATGDRYNSFLSVYAYLCVCFCVFTC